MNRQNGVQRRIALSLLIGLLVAVAPACTQQPEPQQPTPAPSDPQPKSAKDVKAEQDKQGGTVGKSKLEKETGTVNDRIFEVLPNYGTVENAKELPPLTSAKNSGWRPRGFSIGQHIRLTA